MRRLTRSLHFVRARESTLNECEGTSRKWNCGTRRGERCGGLGPASSVRGSCFRRGVEDNQRRSFRDISGLHFKPHYFPAQPIGLASRRSSKS